MLELDKHCCCLQTQSVETLAHFAQEQDRNQQFRRVIARGMRAAHRSGGGGPRPFRSSSKGGAAPAPLTNYYGEPGSPSSRSSLAFAASVYLQQPPSPSAAAAGGGMSSPVIRAMMNPTAAAAAAEKAAKAAARLSIPGGPGTRTLVVPVVDNSASRMALAVALAIVRTKGDVLRLVTVVPTSYAEVTGQQLLAKFQEVAATGCCTTCCDVVVGGKDNGTLNP